MRLTKAEYSNPGPDLLPSQRSAPYVVGLGRGLALRPAGALPKGGGSEDPIMWLSAFLAASVFPGSVVRGRFLIPACVSQGGARSRGHGWPQATGAAGAPAALTAASTPPSWSVSEGSVRHAATVVAQRFA